MKSNEVTSNGMAHISKSLEDTRAVAEEFLGSLSPSNKATVVGLRGDLGSGKTAFAQAVGKILEVEEDLRSPTFVIMKIYRIMNHESGVKNLVHIDAYRLERDEELLHLGWEELINEPENLVLIEWPENVEGIMPEHTRYIDFRFIDETTREISL